MVSICMTVGLTSCLSSSEVDVRKAKQLLGEKKPLEAAVLYSRVADRAGVKADAYAAEAAFEAARIYQYDIKDFEKAVQRYRQVIRLSDKADLRRESQSKLSSILFYDLQDFAGAVIEYSKLLALQHTMDEEIEWRSRIAKAYYYQGDYFQSKIEVDKALQLPLSEEALYQAQLLKANIAIGAREHEEAAKVLEQMIAKFPERAKKDSLSLMLAVAFEEQRNFAKASRRLNEFARMTLARRLSKKKFNRSKSGKANSPAREVLENESQCDDLYCHGIRGRCCRFGWSVARPAL